MAQVIATTTFSLEGYRVVKTIGVVRGILVRSRSIFGSMGAAFQTLLGGNITLLIELCEKARLDAHEMMIKQATDQGGNAVLGVRYESTEIMEGVTEVLCYGTAVVVEPIV